jgi:hypothetical protein
MKAVRGQAGEFGAANNWIRADCRYLCNVFVHLKCTTMEFPDMDTSPRLRCLKGSKEALETAATFKILKRPKKPKIN